MNNTEIRDFFDSLNDEQKKAALAYHTEEDIERVIDQCDIELSLDMLEDVSGGQGAFLPTLLSGIILMSGAASLKTSADEPAVYAAPTGATVSDMMSVEEHDNEIVLTPGEISKYITDMSYFAHSPGFTVSNLFQEMVRKYGRDLTEDLYVRGCKLVLSKKYNVAVEDIDKEYPGLIENARRAVYPFRMNEYAHKQNWENWVDIPDNYFRGIDEGLTQDELDELTAFGKTYILNYGAVDDFIYMLIPDMLRIYGRNLTPEVLGRELVRVWYNIFARNGKIPMQTDINVKVPAITGKSKLLYDDYVTKRATLLRSWEISKGMYWLADWDYLSSEHHKYK